jgi:hypothetical protein
MKGQKTAKARKGRAQGRPRHLDPPKLLATTLPLSVYRLLDDLAEALRRTKSQILVEALQAYAAKYASFLPRHKQLDKR